LLTGWKKNGSPPKSHTQLLTIAPRIDILSEAIYDVFAPIEVVGFTPEEWDNQTSPLYDYAKQGEILYAA